MRKLEALLLVTVMISTWDPVFADYPYPGELDWAVAGEGGVFGWDGKISYHERPPSGAVPNLVSYLKGMFGALVMVVFGAVGCVLLVVASFQRKRAPMVWGCCCLVVAAAAFFSRGPLATFFNDSQVTSP